MSNGLVTVSNGHATMAKTEGGGDVLSAAVQEITKTENKPNVAMVSEHREEGSSHKYEVTSCLVQ